MLTFFAIILTTFLAAVISTPVVIKLAMRLGLLDDPHIRKHPANTHTGVVPRAGGLAVYIAVLIGVLLFIPLNKIIIAILIGGFLIVLLGLLDDYFDLSPYLRFVLNIVIVLFVVMAGLGVPYITNPLGGVIHLDSVKYTVDFFGQHDFLILANLFSLIWVVAIMNFINWSGGVDGQLPGFVGISSFFLGLVAFRFTAHNISNESVVHLAFIIGAAYLGFLIWNFYPQKIMPGYSGGALAGFFLGVLSILSWGKIGTMLLVLSVPLVDAIYVVARRIINKQSPFKGDAGHFHHRLLKIGWGRRRIAVFYWIVSFLFGMAALFFHSMQKVLAILFVVVLLACFIVIIDRIRTVRASG